VKIFIRATTIAIPSLSSQPAKCFWPGEKRVGGSAGQRVGGSAGRRVGVRRSAFGVRRSAFSVQRSAFSVQRRSPIRRHVSPPTVGRFVDKDFPTLQAIPHLLASPTRRHADPFLPPADPFLPRPWDASLTRIFRRSRLRPAFRFADPPARRPADPFLPPADPFLPPADPFLPRPAGRFVDKDFPTLQATPSLSLRRPADTPIRRPVSPARRPVSPARRPVSPPTRFSPELLPQGTFRSRPIITPWMTSSAAGSRSG